MYSVRMHPKSSASGENPALSAMGTQKANSTSTENLAILGLRQANSYNVSYQAVRKILNPGS